MKPGDLAIEGTAVPGDRPPHERRVLGPFSPEDFAAAVDVPSLPDETGGPGLGVVLALDLGTHTGWAMRPVPGALVSGVQHFAPSKFEGGGMRFLRFKHWLTEIKAGGLSAVYFEEVVFHGKFNSVGAAHLYGGLLAILTAWCEHHRIPYRGIPVATIKKSFTGRGNASKDEMINRARALGHQIEDDNEADAIAILLFVEEMMAPKRTARGDPF